MPCESCTVQFSVFKRKRACSECERYYCSACLRRGGGAMCAPCRVLSTRPLSRQTIANLKVRDIQCFLQRQNVSTRGCVEKEELVSLCISHVNSSSYRRRGARPGASFTTFKGITTNINDFINSAFDLRNTSQSAPSPPTRGFANNCFNTGHAHGSPANNTSPSAPPYPDQERFTTRPGGEPDVVVASPESSSSVSRSSSGGPRVDTADCYEIEDLDDAGWEFVTRPADPLPNDSQLLMSTSATSESGAGMASVVGGGMSRALSVSDPELHHHPHPAGLPHEPPSPRGEHVEDTGIYTPPRAPRQPAPRDHASDIGTNYVSPKRINVEQFKSAAELEQLSVKQLKELLTRNRVEYRGCLERKDLLERAKTLWKNYAELKDEVDNLPLEECCKICMAAPLECVLLECGHIAACTLCATQLSECPICRQYVVRAVRFFRS